MRRKWEDRGRGRVQKDGVVGGGVGGGGGFAAAWANPRGARLCSCDAQGSPCSPSISAT